MSVRGWLTTPSTARDVTALSMVVALLYLLSGNHPALGSATRYTESCREMVELGQWTVPHLGYVPYFEKPILTYWLGAATQWLFGGGNLASNLPAGVAMLVSVLATYGLGTRLRDSAFGLGAACFLLTCGLFLAMGSTLTTDPILSACLAMAWLCFFRWDEGRWDEGRREKNQQAGRQWIWGFWVALGLAFLSKGPIAIVLAGAAIGGYALLSGGLRGVVVTLWQMHPLRGVAVLLAINLPWSLAVWARDPRFLEYFYVRINFQAFFDGSINHAGPWWYYGPVIAGSLAPFSVVAIPAVVIACWRALAPAVARLGQRAAVLGTASDSLPPERRGRLFLASVAFFPLAFLSISASKLGTYTLPLLPAFVLLALDVVWTSSAQARRWWAGLLLAQAAVIVIGLAIAPWILIALDVAAESGTTPIFLQGLGITANDEVLLRSVNWAYLPAALLALAVLAGGTIWLAVAAARGHIGRALTVLGATFALVVVIMLPRIAGLVIDLNGSRLMAIVRHEGTPSDPVIMTSDVIHYYELVHALGRRAHAFGHTRELGMGYFAEVEPTAPFPLETYHVSGDLLPQHPWLYSTARLQTEWSGARRLWMVGEDDLAPRLLELGLTVHVIDRARNIFLISNQPSVPSSAGTPR